MEKKYLGDLIITQENKKQYEDIEIIENDLFIRADFIANKLQLVKGDIYVTENISFTANFLTKITGGIRLLGNNVLIANKLKSLMRLKIYKQPKIVEFKELTYIDFISISDNIDIKLDNFRYVKDMWVGKNSRLEIKNADFELFTDNCGEIIIKNQLITAKYS